MLEVLVQKIPNVQAEHAHVGVAQTLTKKYSIDLDVTQTLNVRVNTAQLGTILLVVLVVVFPVE